MTYLQNGVVKYTSAVAPTYPLWADTALYDVGATLTDLVVSEISWTRTASVIVSAGTLTKTGSAGWNARRGIHGVDRVGRRLRRVHRERDEHDARVRPGRQRLELRPGPDRLRDPAPVERRRAGLRVGHAARDVRHLRVRRPLPRRGAVRAGRLPQERRRLLHEHARSDLSAEGRDVARHGRAGRCGRSGSASWSGRTRWASRSGATACSTRQLPAGATRARRRR